MFPSRAAGLTLLPSAGLEMKIRSLASHLPAELAFYEIFVTLGTTLLGRPWEAEGRGPPHAGMAVFLLGKEQEENGQMLLLHLKIKLGKPRVQDGVVVRWQYSVTWSSLW